jgi:hypothetical protein
MVFHKITFNNDIMYKDLAEYRGYNVSNLMLEIN